MIRCRGAFSSAFARSDPYPSSGSRSSSFVQRLSGLERPSATVQNLRKYLLRWNPRPRVCPHYLAGRPRSDRWRVTGVGAADFSEYPLAWLSNRRHQVDRQLARPFRSCGRHCGTPEILGREGGGEQLDGRSHEAGRRSQRRSAIWSYRPNRSVAHVEVLKNGQTLTAGAVTVTAHMTPPTSLIFAANFRSGYFESLWHRDCVG